MIRRVGKHRRSARPPRVKDPRGGLTAAGRKLFAKKQGAHLRPGVRKPETEMTTQDMKRKGSFLRRHYARPPSPLVNPKGEPTRYALQAQAWGEPVPRSVRDVRRLAAKGKRLLAKAKRTSSPRKRT